MTLTNTQKDESKDEKSGTEKVLILVGIDFQKDDLVRCTKLRD